MYLQWQLSATFSFPVEKSDKNAKVGWAAIELYRREKGGMMSVEYEFFATRSIRNHDMELQDFKSNICKETRNRKWKRCGWDISRSWVTFCRVTCRVDLLFASALFGSFSTSIFRRIYLIPISFRIKYSNIWTNVFFFLYISKLLIYAINEKLNFLFNWLIFF